MRKQRATVKCSRFKAEGHTIRTCSQQAGSIVNLPNIASGSLGGGTQIPSLMLNSGRRKRQQEDDSGDESGSEKGNDDCPGLVDIESDDDSDNGEEDEDENCEIASPMPSSSSSSSSAQPAVQTISAWRNSGIS